MSSKPIVFWDIDGTLVSGSLEREFIRYLRDQKLIRSSAIPFRFLSLALRWPLPQWYQVKLCYLRGVSGTEVEMWAENCWDAELRARLFPDAVDAIRHFASLSLKQVLLSGTIKPLADQLARQASIGEIIAANPEVVNGHYTGATESAHPHGLTKVALVEEWLTKNRRNWDEVIAIANHWDDRFLLERCGTPIAAHPDDKLREFAIERNWMIVDELVELRRLSFGER